MGEGEREEKIRPVHRTDFVRGKLKPKKDGRMGPATHFLPDRLNSLASTQTDLLFHILARRAGCRSVWNELHLYMVRW